MVIRPKCSCSGSTHLMFSCSGAADVAEIGDRAVRSLHKAGAAKMFCLAGIARKIELDLGFEEGKAPVTGERIDMVAAKLRELLGGRPEPVEA